jgi:hypothetical protein
MVATYELVYLDFCKRKSLKQRDDPIDNEGDGNEDLLGHQGHVQFPGAQRAP